MTVAFSECGKRHHRGRSHAAGLIARALILAPVCASVLLLQGLLLRPGPPQQLQAGTTRAFPAAP